MIKTSDRIKVLLKRLMTLQPNLKVRTSEVNFGAVHIEKFYELVDTVKDLNIVLRDNKLVQDLLSELQRVDEVGITSDEVGYAIEGKANILNDHITGLLNTLHNIQPNENPNSINVKLPASTQNLDDLAKYSRDLHIAISQLIVNEDINGVEKIDSVDNGSIWLNIYLGTPLAVSLIAGAFWAAAVIRKKWAEGDFAIEQVKVMKVKQDVLKGIQEAHSKAIKDQFEAEAKLLQSQYFKDDNPENVQRIQNSIKLFTELIYQGVEIQPALSAPEEISNLFPSSLNLIESKVAKLKNSN